MLEIIQEIELIKIWRNELENSIKQIINQFNDLHLIGKEYSKSKKNKHEIGFNIFTLTSDFYYRENFHSDIISSLLNPSEKHGEKNKYLHLFIDLINKYHSTKIIEKDNFENAIVQREKHNIDILITDTNSRKAIIIENKINNAIDQPKQLPKYLEAVKKEFDVVSIVYLTLASNKKPDKSDWTETESNEINSILTIISSYESDNNKPNLHDNWILPSVIISNNIDSSLILRQYGNLIKFLNTNSMDTVSLEKFYDSISSSDNLKTAKSIRNMLNDLPEYLAIRIEERYKSSCFPFKNIWRYKLRDVVFEGYELNNMYFKLDIWCDENGYKAHFWNTKINDYDILYELKKIETFQDFQYHEGKKNNIAKHFNFNEENVLFDFIDKLLSELKKLKEI